MITLASVQRDLWKIVSTSIYGAVVVVLYGISTLYHSFQGRPKKIFQKLDHIAIYLMIAGSCTPFALVSLRDGLGWYLFAVNWGLAALGITYELTLAHRTRVPSLITYVAMGAILLFALKPLQATLSTSGVVWLLLSGSLYAIGIGFFLYDEKVQHFHGIWHLFVLAGSLCHYFCVAIYVI